MIYFVRHGQTADNLNNIYTGQKDVPLNENGIAQAKETAKMLKDVKFDVCFCSPLVRARQTCEEILKSHPGLKVNFDDRLKERDYGKLVGLSVGSIKFNRWKVGDDDGMNKQYQIEEIMSVYNRVADFYDEVLPKYKGKNVLVVAHSGIGRIGSAYFNGMPENLDFSLIQIKNAEVLKFEN